MRRLPKRRTGSLPAELDRGAGTGSTDGAPPAGLRILFGASHGMRAASVRTPLPSGDEVCHDAGCDCPAPDTDASGSLLGDAE